MELPDGRPLIVHDALIEPTPTGRIVLWLPAGRVGAYRYWERLNTVAHAGVVRDQGFCSIAAASIRARQRIGFSLSRIFLGTRRTRSDRRWTLPDGSEAEQCEERRTDVRLAWAVDDATALDEPAIKDSWPESREIRSIGRNLYVIWGTATGGTPTGPSPGPEVSPDISETSPSTLAERALAEAIRTGDRSGEVTAMSDLGLALYYQGDAARAGDVLAQGLAKARELGETGLEADTASNLALVACNLGRTRQAFELLAPVLAYTRTAGDRHAETLALERLAEALRSIGDDAGSLARFEEARAIAAELGDRRHEAELLWNSAIQHAALGRKERAIAHAQHAVDLLLNLDHPAAKWYAHHLANYHRADPTPLLAARVGANLLDFGGTIDASAAMAGHGNTASSEIEAGPNLLRMAFTAAKSMTTFLGSGFRTTPSDAYRGRLEICRACQHHTGVRCRLCGCFTAAKAKLLHERCPVGRWNENFPEALPAGKR